jgi:hypothetical protein
MKQLILTVILILGTLAVSAQVPKKGFVSEIMNGGRIVDGKEILVGELPFYKGQGSPFSLMIVPKDSSNVKEVEIVKARYYQGDVVRDVPIMVNQWNVPALVEMGSDNTAIFTKYRVFVGFGQDIEGY